MIKAFTKYCWVKPLRDKKVETALNGFMKIVNESNCNPNIYGFISKDDFAVDLY